MKFVTNSLGHRAAPLLAITFAVFFTGRAYAQTAPLSELEQQPNGLFYRVNTIPPFTGTATEDFPNGKKKVRAQFKEGKPNGEVKQWYDNGELESEVHYENGIRAGKETQYYPTGGKKTELNYVNDLPEGTVTEWYEDGQKQSEGTFKEGAPVGEHSWWYRNGQLDQQIPYANGLANGKVRHWYESGQLNLETDFVDGLKNGNIKEWYDNGALKLEGTFKEDKENGPASYYSRGGVLQEVKVYDMGTLKQVKEYRSGAIKISGKRFVQVFNEKDDFFVLDVMGNDYVRDRSGADITYTVDKMLLQISTLPVKVLDVQVQSKEAVLKSFMDFEKKYIEKGTKGSILPQSEAGTTASGVPYLHWHYDSPGTDGQRPQRILREHYLSIVVGGQVLSLYSLVTKQDDEARVVEMLKGVANSLRVEQARIDLNALRFKLLGK